MTLKDKQETNDNASSLSGNRPVERRVGRPRLWPPVRLAPGLEWVHEDRNENRARIVAALEDVPGLTFRGLARAINLAHGTLRHHLSRLEAQGRVWRLVDGGAHRYFAGACPEEVAPRVLASSCMVDELDHRILAELDREQMQKTILDAVQGVAVSRSTVQHRLERLTRMGIITAVRSGRCLYYRRCDS